MTTKKNNLLPSKQKLRELARETSGLLTADEHKLSSKSLSQTLADFLVSEFPHSPRIATFAALSHEPDLSLLDARLPKHQFFYPLVINENEMSFHLVDDRATLREGSYGILEPNPAAHPRVEAADLDLILVPGLSFDLRGNRLGHGKGYYDRYLEQISSTPTVGIAFQSQILSSIPAEPHDHRVTFLATEQGVTPIPN